MSTAKPNLTDPILAAVDLRQGPQAQALLQAVIDRCRARGSQGVAVFDLDSTLLDTRQRQAKILAEYGAAAGVPALAACQPEHWDGWDYIAAMVRAGLPHAQAQQHAEPYRAQWHDRFFTSEYCRVDEAMPGAAAFVRAVLETGARVCYVTGRHEGMRAGTVQCFDRVGIPAPDGDRVQLWMKPTLEEDDDVYKARVHADLPKKLGTVVAAFDNEPTHINDYRRSFPQALIVHLATDHSMRDIPVDPQIPSVADFSAHDGT